MSLTDFFGDVFGQESTVAMLARSIGRQWGEGAMQAGTEEEPTEWGRFLAVRAGYFADLRSYIEAVGEQAYPHLAEHSVETWEYIKNIPPAPATMLLGDRLQRALAYCQVGLGARPADITAALESLLGLDNAAIEEHTAAGSVLDPERVYEFYTLVDAASWAVGDTVDDVIRIVDRWKPAHTRHGREIDNPRAGVRVGDASDVSTPAWFKTGTGPEKTSRNLIQYS
jgi:hypothetical protein